LFNVGNVIGWNYFYWLLAISLWNCYKFYDLTLQ
jgi:hypothetical protein